MQNLLVSFFNGFLSTLFLFVLSGIIVIGAKILQVFFQKTFPKTQIVQKPIPQETPPPPPKKARQKKSSSNRAVIKSIEIDPKKVDRIYVKRN